MEDLPTVVRQQYEGLLAIGKFREGENYLLQQLHKTPSKKLELTLAVHRYTYLAKTQLAAASLQALAEKYPEDIEIKLYLADLYYLIFHDEQGLAAYTAARKTTALPKIHWRQFINIKMRNDQFADAHQEMNKLLEFYKQQLDLHDITLMLRILLKQELLQDAINLTNAVVNQQAFKDQYASLAEQFSIYGYRAIANELMLAANNLSNHEHSMYFKQKVLFYKQAEFYKAFCQGGQDYVDQTGVAADASFEPGQLIEVWCVVYGKAHIDMLEKICLPTLFFNTGFNELLKERKLIFNIYTLKEHLGELDPVIRLLQSRNIGFRINLTLLDSIIDPVFYQGPFAANSLTLLDQIRRSIKYKSIILSVLPDLLMQGGSLKRVIDNMKYNDFVVCRGPRINSEVAVNEMIQYYAKYQKKFDDHEFIKLCMTKFIHPQTEVGLNSDNHLLTIKNTKLGYEVQTACPQPLCFYGQQKMIDRMLNDPGTGHRIQSSFFCIDNDFVDMAYRDNELVYLKDSDEFFWAELTGMNNHQPHQFFRGWADVNNSYYPEGYRYCRTQTVLWRCEI